MSVHLVVHSCCFMPLLMDSSSKHMYARENTLLAAKGGCNCTPLTPLTPPPPLNPPLVRVAFPSLARCLLGSAVTIPDSDMSSSFLSSLSCHDYGIIEAAYQEVKSGVANFTAHTQSGLIELCGRLDRFLTLTIWRVHCFKFYYTNLL